MGMGVLRAGVGPRLGQQHEHLGLSANGSHYRQLNGMVSHHISYYENNTTHVIPSLLVLNTTHTKPFFFGIVSVESLLSHHPSIIPFKNLIVI